MIWLLNKLFGVGGIMALTRKIVENELRYCLKIDGDGNLAALCRFWLAHQWQPIATAPKDGTAMFALWGQLAGNPITAQNYAVAEFSAGDWRPPGDDEDVAWSEPSYWQPLPPPPAKEGQQT